ncbi:FkbM family methyltransferase [Salibaculum sp.]|uniref:FkbM family methyltransferase n=1 Tax=Salibaculum sp. TaxID=2855480 RepID=UPI002B48EBC8|nr:FkbM family methyltransferase [Salibaculum sp.]HKL70277.1 FkbM family methyltransferase [Salibaculum sp.]
MSRLEVLSRHLSPARAMRVCDVGANPLGAPPYQPLLEAGLCDVYGFEPHAEAFAKLQQTKSDRETYFPVAIGRPGERVLHVHPNSGFTSLFPFDGRALGQLGKEKWMSPRRPIETVPMRTTGLDEVTGLPGVDVLKMDLQGAEGEVVETGPRTLSETVAILTEVRFHRIYEDEPVFGDLDATLRANGFKLHKFLFTKSVMLPHDHEDLVHRPAMTSQLLDGDAVYLRDVPGPDALSDDQLAHLALAADTMFDSPDIALQALGALARRGRAEPGAAPAYAEVLEPRRKARDTRKTEKA